MKITDIRYLKKKENTFTSLKTLGIQLPPYFGYPTTPIFFTDIEKQPQPSQYWKL